VQLLLHIDTKGVPSSVLDAVYAFFPPYTFTDKSGSGVLETTIDAAHDLTDAQWAIIAATNATVDLVLPDGMVKALPVEAPPSSPSPSSSSSSLPENSSSAETTQVTAPIPVVVTATSGPNTGTMTFSAAAAVPTSIGGDMTTNTMTTMSGGTVLFS